MKRTFIILLTLITALITQPSFAVNPVLSLDGDGDYVEITNSENLNAINSQVTMEAWIKATAFPGQWMFIVYKGDKRVSNECRNRSYTLMLNSSGFISLASAPEGQAQIDISSTGGLIALNTWYHVAGVVDAKNRVMRIFINGVEVARGDFGKDIHVSQLPFRIGWGHEAEVPEHNTFEGQIDEVRIFNYARTQEDIQMTMHTTLSGKEMGLVGYWRFDAAVDLSPYGNDGQLFGDAKFVESDLQLELVPTTANLIHVPKDYPTIQAAIDATDKGDVVVVSPGTYHEIIRLKSDVMLRGMDAVISGDGNAIVEAVNVTNASLMGFTIDGIDVAKNGILCKGNSDVNIRYNVILLCENAIGCFGSSRPKIRKNTFAFNNIGVGIFDFAQPIIGGSEGASNDFLGNAVVIRNETPNRINAAHNYWGEIDENRIAELIKNTGGGNVDFTSFLANVTRTSGKFWTNASALSSAALMFSRLNQSDRALLCAKRAIEVSERAVELDSFSIESRRTLGEIYLEFANTFASGVRKSPLTPLWQNFRQKALEQFEWVLFSEPLDQESWNGVYQIALSDIDKKEFSAFASRLRKVFWEGTPQRKFLDGAEALRNADEDVRLKAIKTAPNSAWLVLGPFEIPDRRLELFNFIQSGGDAKLLQPDAESSIIRVDPNTTYPADGKQLKWTKIEEQDANANFDGTAYSSTIIISPDERQALLVCQGNAIKVWLNRQIISERVFPTDMTIPVTLRKGSSRIVVKTTGKTENWNLTIGVADAMGRPVRDIRFASAYESRGMKDKLRSISVNHALSLDGDGDYVEVADNPSLDLSSQFTIEGWFRVNTAIPDRNSAIPLTKGSYGGPYWFELYPDNMLCRTVLGDSGCHAVLGAATLNQWVHYAVTYDGDILRGFQNGELYSYKNVPNYPVGQNDTALTFGKKHHEWGWGSIWYDGQIDEVRIFDYARTPEEIQATLNTTLTGDEAGLVGYWNFDDATADDLSPNRNDGTLYGGAKIVESDLKRLSFQMAIDTVDGFNTVPVNQKGQFVLTTGIGAHEVAKPIKTIEIQISKAFRSSGTKVIGDILFDAQPFKASSTRAGSVLRIQLEKGITETGRLKINFEATAGSTTASNVMFTVRLLAADGTVIRESPWDSIAIISDAPLPAPNDVVANPVAGENDVTISWTPSDGERVQLYEVLADGNKIGAIAPLLAGIGGGRLTYTHINAQPGAKLSYTVVAVDASTLKSEPSQAVTVTVGQDTTPPESPQYVQMKRMGSKGVKLTWEAPAPDAVMYHVLRGTSEKDLTKIAEVPAETERKKSFRTPKHSLEYLDPTLRAYLYAIDVVDDQGHSAPKPLRIFPAKPKAGEIESVSIVMGEKNEIDGIRMPNAGDGQHESTIITGKPCRRNRPNGRYLYFDVDDGFADRPPHGMYVTLEIFDESAGSFYIDYGVSQSLREPLSGSGRWRTVTFHIPNARFANQQPYRSDFRLVSEGRLAVASLAVSKGRPVGAGLKPASTLRTMQWALIGPFDITSNNISDFETSQPPEDIIDLNATYQNRTGEFGWFESPKYAEYADLAEFVDLGEMLSWSSWVVGYALTYLESPKDELVQLVFDNTGPMKVWLNDVLVGSQSNTMPQRLVAVAELKKGVNKILIKSLQVGGSWGFSFRVTDQKGNPLKKINYLSPYDYLPEGKEVPRAAEERLLPPTQVRAIPLSGGAVKLWWEPSPSANLKEYRIYTLKKGGGLKRVATVAKTERNWQSPSWKPWRFFRRFGLDIKHPGCWFGHGGFTPGVKHSFVVAAVSETGDEMLSTVAERKPMLEYVDIANYSPGVAAFNSALIDEAGNVWGSSETGIHYYDAQTKEWRTYTTEDGLPDNARAKGLSWMGNPFVRDDKGAVWIATGSGLARFDGETWEGHLAGSNVTSVEIDDKGQVWALVANQQIKKFDGGEWKDISTDSATLFDLAVDEAGRLWVSGRDGRLGMYDGEKWSWATDTLSDRLGNVVHRFAVDKRRKGVWVASFFWPPLRPGGLKFFDGTHWTSHLDGETIWWVAIDKHGTVWAAISSGEQLTTKKYSGDKWEEVPGVVRVMLDVAGEPWFMSERRLEKYDQSVTIELPPLMTELPNTLLVDNKDRLWLGGGEQIGVYDGDAMQLYTQKDGITGTVASLAFSPDGEIWAATDAGVNRFTDGKWMTVTTADGLPGDDVSHLATDPKGRVWIIAQNQEGDRTLAVHDGMKWEERAPAGGFASTNFTALAVDKDGTVWLGTSDKGVFLYDGTLWRTYDSSNGLTNDRIFKILPDGKGNVWVLADRNLVSSAPGFGTSASSQTGTTMDVYRFNGTGWETLETPWHSWGQTNRRCAVLDGKGHLWVGLNPDSKLYQYDGERWFIYNPDDKWPGDTVPWEIATDNHDDLWVVYSHFAGNFISKLETPPPEASPYALAFLILPFVSLGIAVPLTYRRVRQMPYFIARRFYNRSIVPAPQLMYPETYHLMQDKSLPFGSKAVAILPHLARFARSDDREDLAIRFNAFAQVIGKDEYNTALAVAVDAFSQPAELEWNAQVATVYEWLLTAYRADTVSSISALATEMTESLANVAAGSVPPDFPLAECVESLKQLSKAATDVRKNERVENVEDKIVYLNGAIRILEETSRDLNKNVLPPELDILAEIIHRWRIGIGNALTELQSTAQLRPELKTKEIIRIDSATLLLEIVNVGRGHAENVMVTLESVGQTVSLPEERTDSSLYKKEVSTILQGRRAQVEFPLNLQDLTESEVSATSATESGAISWRVNFVIEYDDQRREGNRQEFADTVQFLQQEEKEFRQAPNPYIVGKPLRPEDPFVGREETFEFIRQNLKGETRDNIIILHGYRRTGKTSILYQLQRVLADEYIPVLIDVQGMVDEGLDAFLSNLAFQIYRAFRNAGIRLPRPKPADFKEQPGAYFRNEFLDMALENSDERDLLLMFDEFEVLERLVREGKLDAGIFGYLRNLMQHEERVNFIFSGTHRLEEMVGDYWSILFNIALYKTVSFLEEPAAERLIREPVKDYFDYDALAVEKILRTTGCHPHFTQLLCHSLVNYRNERKVNYITIEDVNKVINEVVEFGQVHIDYLWRESPPEAQLFMMALHIVLRRDGIATRSAILDALRDYRLDRNWQSAIDNLLKRDVVTEQDGHFNFRVNLISDWLEANKRMQSVIEETRQAE